MPSDRGMDAVLSARRARASQAWNLTDEIVIVGAGSPIGIPGGFDQCYEYRPHPQYRWLTESARPGSVIAFDPRSGWTHFVPPLTQLERVWDGEPEIPAGESREGLTAWLEARKGRKAAVLGSPIEGIQGDEELSKTLVTALDHERRSKDEHELSLMRRAAVATAAGYGAASEFIRPGVTERQIQTVLESAMLNAGADGMGYASIVGTGSNSRIFHFTPGAREVQPNDLVLIDAGAHVDGYVIDVTRTFPASGKWEGRQLAIRDIVRAAEEASFAKCRVGTRWSESHRAAAYVIGQGLKDLGLVTTSVEDFCESGAVALFFPHGVGHAVGLGVRDSGGAMPGEHGEPRVVCGSRVRVDLPMKAGYVMTVEPGCYFIPALLTDVDKRAEHKDRLAWDKLDDWMDFGGVRIEDNLLITDGEPENLTIAIPY